MRLLEDMGTRQRLIGHKSNGAGAAAPRARSLDFFTSAVRVEQFQIRLKVSLGLSRGHAADMITRAAEMVDPHSFCL